jgi:hypothetical protein
MRYDLTPINDDTSLVSCGTFFIETLHQIFVCFAWSFQQPEFLVLSIDPTKPSSGLMWIMARQCWQQSILSIKVFRRAWENEWLARCELYLGFEEMGEMPSSCLLSNLNNNCFRRRQMEFSELRKIYRMAWWKEHKNTKPFASPNYCFDNKLPARASFPCQAVGMNKGKYTTRNEACCRANGINGDLIKTWAFPQNRSISNLSSASLHRSRIRIENL